MDKGPYDLAKEYFDDKFAEDRRNIIREFSIKRDEIQQNAKKTNQSSIVSTYGSLFGGIMIAGGLVAAPFTGGASMGCIRPGVALTIGFPFYRAAYREVNEYHQRQILTKLEQLWLSHEEKCIEMNKRLLPLNKKIEMVQGDIRKMSLIKPDNGEENKTLEVIQSSSNLIIATEIVYDFVEKLPLKSIKSFKISDWMSIDFKSLLQPAPGTSNEKYRTLSFATVLINIRNLFWHHTDMNKLDNDIPCDRAYALKLIIDHMQRELDDLCIYFE